MTALDAVQSCLEWLFEHADALPSEAPISWPLHEHDDVRPDIHVARASEVLCFANLLFTHQKTREIHRLLAVPTKGRVAESLAIVRAAKYDGQLPALKTRTLTIPDMLCTIRDHMETVPSTHHEKSEEGIRDVILTALSPYVTNIGAETFRRGGKTDIVIPLNPRSVFVAELKIWNGPGVIAPAIDQLLRLLTSGDRHAALLIIVRDTAITRIAKDLRALMLAHPCHVKEVSEQDEGLRRDYHFSHPSDCDQRIHLSVILFPLTGRASPRTQQRPKA